MNIIKQIENYILYLITECGLSVTLHPLRTESLITFSRLMRFNIHDNSYCSYIKSTRDGRVLCRAQQKRVLKRCGEEPFCGQCYAGVFEYVYPLFNGTETVGFISVSGYAHPEGERRAEAVAAQLGYSVAAMKNAYATLQTRRPDQERIDTLLNPLCRMLELAYCKNTVSTEEETLTEQILRYVRQHFFMDITTEQICKTFHCSRSFFSHNFKKEVGKSFREYLTDLRLDYAKRLLKYSAMRINEIAFSVGFNDANYFSGIFRRKLGVSPMDYRKNQNGKDCQNGKNVV